MRLYLDTNILLFLITEQRDEICHGLQETLSDYGNILLTSSVCVHELIHLYQIGKIPFKKHANVPKPAEVVGWLDEMGIEVIPVNKRHLQCYSELPLHDGHHDPNDRLIIAQAIADRTPLVSSDRKFSRYARHGLDFIFNER